MENTKDRIINSIFKILHIYEQDGYENYHGYLSTISMELGGKTDIVNQKVLEQTADGLRGLYRLKDSVDHDEVRKTVLRYANRIDREYKEG